MKYTFRNYNDNDYNLIYDLKKQAFQGYVNHFWGLWDDEKQHEFFDNYIKAQRDRIKIIVLDGKDIGYFDDKLCGNEYEIVNIIIKPEYQGKGVGTEILKTAIKEHLKNEVHIQCFKTNPVKNLYFKLGFEEIEQTKTHIKMELNKEKYLTHENDTKCGVIKEWKMEELYLKEIEMKDEKDIVDYINEFVRNGSVINGLSGATSCKTFQELYEKLQKQKKLKFDNYNQEDRSPSLTYMLKRKSDERLIGTFNLRLNLTKSLDDNFAGHIGYGVRPSERRKGYATQGLKLILDVCRGKGMNFVRLGCYSENIGSKNTIIKNGGKLINHTDSLISEDYYEIEL